MTGTRQSSEIMLFTGRFGSGKTEAAINWAVAQAQSMAVSSAGTPAALAVTDRDSVALIDLDIVTPYFRTREAAAALRDRGVEVIAPSVIGLHLDTPAITPQILGSLQQADRPTILDVGGDRQGARALGQFSAAIRHRGYHMHFVVNPFRPFTNTLEGLAASIEEIQDSARLRVNSLVSNPHLMQETTAELILRGHAILEEFALQLELPIAFVAIERRRLAELGPKQFAQPVLVLERFFVQPWETHRERVPEDPAADCAF